MRGRRGARGVSRLAPAPLRRNRQPHVHSLRISCIYPWRPSRGAGPYSALIGGVELMNRCRSSVCLDVPVFSWMRCRWVLAVVSLMPEHLAASLRRSPGAMASSTRSSLPVRLTVCECLARKRRHHDRVLHEDRHRRSKGATEILALSTSQWKDSGDETCTLPRGKSKCKSALRHFGFIGDCLIDGCGQRSSRPAVNGGKAVVLNAKRIARFNLPFRRAVHEYDAAMAVFEIHNGRQCIERRLQGF